MTSAPFTACLLELADPASRESVVRSLWQAVPPALLVLSTCQRLECYGRHPPSLPGVRVKHRWDRREAFERLARIAAGLESRVLGELEVLGQVREAYRQFRVAGGENDSLLDRLFQDALALARRARRESGIDQTQTSLASLACRQLLARIPAGAPLAVVGSGSLAGSVARYLGKRGDSAVRIAGRCPENAVQLASEVGGFGCGLDRLMPMFDGVAGIVTATAAPHPVVYAHHLERAGRPLVIVDLGVPPDCDAEVATLPGVTYIGLREVEAHAHVNIEDRRRRAEEAGRIIAEGAGAWAAGR